MSWAESEYRQDFAEQRRLAEKHDALLAACEATHRYFLAVTSEAVAQGQLQPGFVSGIGLDELAEKAAELTNAAMDKVHGRLTTQLEGQTEVDTQIELRAINQELLAALEVSRAQWIHSVNAAQCEEAITKAKGG